MGGLTGEASRLKGRKAKAVGKASPRRARSNGKSPHGDWRKALDRFTRDLRTAYGRRLDRVVLYGSRARGDAEAASDIDTLVVLDRCQDVHQELERINPLAGRILLEYGIVVSALPVAREDFERSSQPLLVNARREGRIV